MELDERIVVVPYDDEWPILFEEQKKRVSPAFADNAVDIQHFGSTAGGSGSGREAGRRHSGRGSHAGTGRRDHGTAGGTRV